MTQLDSAWEALLSEPSQGEGWLIRRIDRQAPVPILAAVRQPNGIIALLVEVDAESIASTVEYPSARGFEVYPESVQPGPHGIVRLCLVHAEDRANELFRVLAHDIAACVSRADNPQHVARAVLDRLRVWQRFFRRDVEGLSLEEQQGLFGELLFVETLIEAGLKPDSVISSWQGPAGAPRDFCFPACHVEIKAGTSPEGFFVSSLQQLDAESPSILLVVFNLLEETPRGTSLAELVSRIRDALPIANARAAMAFDDRLLQSGYLAGQSAIYGLRRWCIVRRFFFRVHGEFPRIRRAELRSGIVDVHYKVALSECVPYLIPENEAIEIASRVS